MNKKLLILLLFYFWNNLSMNAQIEENNYSQFEVILEDTGDVLMISLPAIAGITTLIKKDWEGTKQFAFSFTANLVITASLKKIIGKQRPGGIDEFDAFPSGHTSFAFPAHHLYKSITDGNMENTHTY